MINAIEEKKTNFAFIFEELWDFLMLEDYDPDPKKYEHLKSGSKKKNRKLSSIQ